MKKHMVAVEVTRVMVLQGRGADTVMLTTTHPTTMPAISNEPLMLKFEVAAGYGPVYLREVLGFTPDMVEIVRLNG